MSRLRITYYAEGHRNGCKVTLHDVCGLVYVGQKYNLHVGH